MTGLKIAVCDSGASLGQICFWLEEYSALYHLRLSLQQLTEPEQLVGQVQPDAAFIGLGGNAGFLAARRLRDRDRHCKIVLIDGTPEYSVRSVRLHCTDFILRPIRFPQIVRSMHLITGRGIL